MNIFFTIIIDVCPPDIIKDKNGNFIFFSINVDNICPSIWFIPIVGIFNIYDRIFANEVPINNGLLKPGPFVYAMHDIFS